MKKGIRKDFTHDEEGYAALPKEHKYERRQVRHLLKHVARGNIHADDFEEIANLL